jgi:rare lipoprotein A
MRRQAFWIFAWPLALLIAFSSGMYCGAKVILGLKEAEVAQADERIVELEREAEQYETVIASWYGTPFHGRRTANMEIFDMHEYTAAHRTLPFGTILLVEYGGRYVVVRVNDRGPFVDGRELDLSYAAARALGIVEAGVVRLRTRVIMTGRVSVED